MTRRTFAIGDVHGEHDDLVRLLAKLPDVGADDTIVFLGDYIDRGTSSAHVVDLVRRLPTMIPSKVVTLRGNHEDAWLRVIDRGWPDFILPAPNGCLATLRSFLGAPAPEHGEIPTKDDFMAMTRGTFFPADVVEWMRSLPYFYEDEHALFVHAGIPKHDGKFPHPSEVTPPHALLWCRDGDFFRNYDGKLVVFGHTATANLPPDLSSYTPEDPLDMWAGPCCIGLDTGCGKGGFLSALELPSRTVYESR